MSLALFNLLPLLPLDSGAHPHIARRGSARACISATNLRANVDAGNHSDHVRNGNRLCERPRRGAALAVIRADYAGYVLDGHAPRVLKAQQQLERELV
jgi:hypothetical protein